MGVLKVREVTPFYGFGIKMIPEYGLTFKKALPWIAAAAAGSYVVGKYKMSNMPTGISNSLRSKSHSGIFSTIGRGFSTIINKVEHVIPSISKILVPNQKQSPIAYPPSDNYPPSVIYQRESYPGGIVPPMGKNMPPVVDLPQYPPEQGGWFNTQLQDPYSGEPYQTTAYSQGSLIPPQYMKYAMIAGAGLVVIMILKR